ncbi:MAG TPA: dihydroorotase [Usitatibacteraceae bacterium]|nr:dihydroorotase [Usitatibacteraceae bacterium]
MSANIEILHGRLVDASRQLDRVASLYLADGTIAAVGEAPAGWKADKTLDARGKVVCPGLVDLSARLREPGSEHKATLESEMLAAVAGGVTTLVCPPDTDPPLDEPGLVEMLKRRAGTLERAQVYPLGALTRGLQGTALAEMAELTDAGCIGFSNADLPVTDTTVLYRALQYAATFGYPVWLRPQEDYLSRGGIAHDGEVASRLGLPGIPVSAETIAISTIVTLMRETGARVHLMRVSSSAGVELVRAAKAEGLPLSADVGIHHLLLTDRDIGYFDPQFRFSPPLRSPRDREALGAAVIDGTIDAIASDHTPVDDDEKNVPFGEAAPGATGLELLLPLALKWAEQMQWRDADVLARITSAPAALLGLSCGTLAAGAPADLCIYDPAAFWAVTRETLRSQGKNSPWLRREMQAKVVTTLVAGRVVYAA